MNRYIVGFLAVLFVLIVYVPKGEPLPEKKIEAKKKKPLPEKRNDTECNTKLGIVFNDCTSMYNIYKEKYTAMVTPEGKPNILAQTICDMSEIVSEQDKIMYEEKCDEIIFPKMKKAIFGLACYQVFHGEKMLYKSEYCKIYK